MNLFKDFLQPGFNKIVVFDGITQICMVPQGHQIFFYGDTNISYTYPV